MTSVCTSTRCRTSDRNRSACSARRSHRSRTYLRSHAPRSRANTTSPDDSRGSSSASRLGTRSANLQRRSSPTPSSCRRRRCRRHHGHRRRDNPHHTSTRCLDRRKPTVHRAASSSRRRAAHHPYRRRRRRSRSLAVHTPRVPSQSKPQSARRRLQVGRANYRAMAPRVNDEDFVSRCRSTRRALGHRACSQGVARRRGAHTARSLLRRSHRAATSSRARDRRAAMRRR
jgi:hypothetical protein